MHVATELSHTRPGTHTCTRIGSDCTLCYDSGEDLLQLLHSQVDRHGLYNIVFDSVSSDDPRDAAHGYEKRLRCTGSAAGGRVGVVDQQAGVYLMLGGHVSGV
jgi:hypothetical protein